MDVRMFTVGMVQENCFLIKNDRDSRALIVDPGDEAEKILAPVEELDLDVEAILLTHCHFDHIGAVAPVAEATGAPVYVSEIERPILADINAYVPWDGFGPFQNHEADYTLKGGERLQLAGFDIDVLFTPGHSPGHLTFSFPDYRAIFSGDVLFRGSVGRTDLPGADWPTLIASIGTIVDSHDDDTTVYPGHMGLTRLGVERKTNPFLVELAQQSSVGHSETEAGS